MILFNQKFKEKLNASSVAFGETDSELSTQFTLRRCDLFVVEDVNKMDFVTKANVKSENSLYTCCLCSIQGKIEPRVLQTREPVRFNVFEDFTELQNG